jgi:ABC-type sulfate transport system permease component
MTAVVVSLVVVSIALMVSQFRAYFKSIEK